MAGGGHHALKHDPAIDRWYQMREDQYKNFRWTKRTARTGFVMMVAIPTAMYFVFREQDMRWKWAAAPKGGSLLRNPPPAAEESEDS